MKIIFSVMLIVLLTILSVNSSASKNDRFSEIPDSILASSDIEEKIDWLLRNSIELTYSSPQQSLEYSRKALKYAEEFNLPQKTISAHLRIANVMIAFGEYSEAWENINLAIDISIENKADDLLASSWRIMGILYDMQGDIHNALKYYHKSLSIFEELNDEIGMAMSYNNIGIMNYELEEYEEALSFYKKSLDYAIESNNQRSISKLYCNIGNVYEKLGEYDIALEYLERALEIDKSLNDKEGMAATIHNIGLVYMRMGKLDEALSNFEQSIDLCYELEDLYRVVTRYTALSELYNLKGEYDKAINFVQKGLEMSQKIGTLGQQPMLYDQLIEAYKKKGNYHNAFEAQSLYIALKDSLFNIEKAKEISKIQTSYQVEQKQQELDKTKMLAAKDRMIRNAFVIAFIISILLIVLIVYAYRNKIITNRQISEQNVALEQANEEIIAQKEEIISQHELVLRHKDLIENQKNNIESSIRYAERIQNAILPTDELCNKILGSHFILFKPKDVVSGDFYFVTKIKDLSVFAVADCTGHGVPGAFMSMLGLSFLKEIIGKKEITQPNEILDKLRQSIIEALQQKGRFGDQSEGLNIAICVLNNKNKMLQFAGANNALTIVTAQKKLKSIKPDKQPIAIHRKMKPFKSEQIQLNENDCLYLASDGYQDQFGGDDHKKFSRKKFNELLLQISDKPVEEQKNILNLTFESWKGNNDQVDDVTVLGIKV